MIRSRDLRRAALLALAACSQAGAPGDNPPTLAGLEISPPAVTLSMGQSVDFSVVGRLTDGSTVLTAHNWVATGGAISAGGTYVAGTTPGSYRVIASTPDLIMADTAPVTIQPATVTLTGVVVTPATATVDPGSSTPFSADGQFSDGSNGPVPVNWTATGGTVSAQGVYLAGPTGGAYRVVATATPSGLADTAQVTIRDTSTATPVVLLTEGFDDASVGSRGWYDNTTPVISNTEQRSGAGALEESWVQGATVPIKGGAIRHKFTPTDRIYLRYWVKYSANWVGSGVNYHPHEFYFLTNEEGDYAGPSTTHLTAYVEHVYQNGGYARVAVTDALNIDVNNLNVDLTGVTEQRAVAGCNGESDGYPTGCYQDPPGWNNQKGWRSAQALFTSNPGPSYQYSWHKVEAYYQLNSIQNGKGVNDGIVRYWFDGQLIIEHPDVLFRTGTHPNMKFQQFLIAPYIGVGSPVNQTMWVDDLVLATGRVP